MIDYICRKAVQNLLISIFVYCFDSISLSQLNLDDRTSIKTNKSKIILRCRLNLTN